MEAPRRAVAAALVLQAVAGLALGLPGHLSVDSVVQYYDDSRVTQTGRRTHKIERR